MTPAELQLAVNAHQGVFLCSQIRKPEVTKTVHFKHQTTSPATIDDLPDIGRLRDFYAVFGSITFYVDSLSMDAARYIATPDEWAELEDGFLIWLEDLDDEEREELLPEWIDTCLVIGEEPETGNYILMPTEGAEAGAVYHFDHDGFEFDRHAPDLLKYTEDLLDLDDHNLSFIACHMRFIEGEDNNIQWWIKELHDNRGNNAKTKDE